MGSDPLLYLFDDARARSWEPLHRTRPTGELLFGCLLLRERAERFWGLRCSGHLTDPLLRGFDEPGSPPVVEGEETDRERPRILFLGRAVPEDGTLPSLETEARLVAEARTVGWILPPGAPLPPPDHLAEPDAAPPRGRDVEVEASILDAPWSLVNATGDRIRRDVEDLYPRHAAFLPAGVHHLGGGLVSEGDGVEIEPGAILDTRNGPIRLEDGVRVRGHTRLIGPLFVGRSSEILGGDVGPGSIGPVCKIRGEVEESVILGFSNKAHEGYLGHSFLGRWVNLGALTTNSDLKNTYGNVRVKWREGIEETGLMKVGCFLGDHVKTGIGVLLPTGGVLGAGSNIMGSEVLPRRVPPFSWGTARKFVPYRLESFLETAERVMARRDQPLTERARELLRRAWEETRDEREASEEGTGA